jgi:hypothetical protein
VSSTTVLDRPAGSQMWRALGREILLMGVLIGGYEWGRHLVSGQTAQATTNAWRIWHLQNFMHLPTEAAVQHWAMAWAPLARIANLYYIGAHFPVTIVVLVWLFARHHGDYLRVRTQLAMATAAGLVLHMFFPLAPPRLIPQFGLTDTMVTVGPSAYPAGPPAQSGFVNQYAAMPSLHVGWALLMAIAVITVARTPWRWLALLHPTLTWFVVVVTANHYWLDGLAGCTLVFGAIALTVGITRYQERYPARPEFVAHPASTFLLSAVIPAPRVDPDSEANITTSAPGLVRRQ